MEPRALNFVAASCQGDLRHGTPDVEIRRVCSDTRQVRAGDLFVALRGERFDGHRFLDEAARRGAAALLVERGREDASWPVLPTVAVADTRQALGRLAAEYRRAFAPVMVAVGGSNGKTTTKELLASLLSTRWTTLRSPASFNNDVGVPHTLLELERQHQAAVLEVGTNHPGELAPLLGLIQPRYGILTSIGREHLEFFADLDGVAREEGVLAELLPAGGRLVLPGETPKRADLVARAACPVVTVGTGPANDWQVTSIRLEEQGTVFAVRAPREEFAGEYRLRLWGRHQALNAALALALAAELGVPAVQARAGLERCEAPKMRLQIVEAHGVRILNDAYNANADSMLAALATLREFPCAGRRVAVLGDMEELGAHSEAAHVEVGRQTAAAELAALFTVGKKAKALAEAARSAGLDRTEAFDSLEAAATAVRAFLRPGDLVLLKASRAIGLERLGALLQA